MELRTVSAVVFDVGETLVDETAYWQQVADQAGVPWGNLHDASEADLRVASLEQLPEALGV